jgi:antibiotic biosynthesis monooxygenase (ABM) superfamily enzyme
LNNGGIFQADFPEKRVLIYGNSRNMEEKKGRGRSENLGIWFDQPAGPKWNYPSSIAAFAIQDLMQYSRCTS